MHEDEEREREKEREGEGEREKGRGSKKNRRKYIERLICVRKKAKEILSPADSEIDKQRECERENIDLTLAFC